ncbi:MAG: isochorismatase [Phycisphaerales bacterium JB043]
MTGSGGEGCFRVSEAFAARRTWYDGCIEDRGWRLKRYVVCAEGREIDGTSLGGGVARLMERLGGLSEHCPGVGFVIVHLGSGWDYLVGCWWDNENELCVRVLSRERGEERWAVARENQSFCVWDMEVMWHERNAYVEHVLTDTRGDVEGYMRDVLGSASGPDDEIG